MKRILTLLLVVTLSMSLFALDIFKYVPFSGDVKSYTQTDFTITSKFGDLFRTPNMKIIHNFDANGNEIEVAELSAKEVLLNKTLSKYDSANNLLEQSCYDASDELLWKTIITYKDGKKIDSSEYGKDGVLRGKVIYGYSGNNLAEETGYDSEGALVWKTIYKYTDNKLTTVSQYALDGSLDSEDVIAYAADGKTESITSTDCFTGVTVQKIFRYAANGNLSEITTYDAAKQIINRLMIKYDNTGNLSRLSEYKISVKFGSTQNELISMSEYAYSDSVTTYEVAEPKAKVIDAK